MQAYRPFQLKFWAYYLVQMRPYLLFVSGAAGLMGMAIGYAHHEDLSPIRLFLAFSAFFLAYGFGQALTDCFQTDTDRLSAPERPLSKGLLNKTAVLTTSLAGLALSAGILVWLHPLNLLFGLLSIAGLSTYTAIKRRYWWGGPPYNALIVTLLPVMGYLTVSPGLTGFPLYLLLMTFFSYANFVLMGYLKDIPADTATGYRTFPVVFGWRKTVQAGHLIAIAATGILIPFLAKGGLSAWIAWVFATVVAIAGQWDASKAQSEHQTAAIFSITCTVRTFILLHWAVILIFQPGWMPAGIFYYLLFEALLYFRFEHNQV